VAGAEQRRHARRSAAAKLAAVTRRDRQEKRVYEAARRIIAGGTIGPGKSYYICGRGLSDPGSEARGIGSECWQFVLYVVTPEGA
jgi:hypothetical protein